MDVPPGLVWLREKPGGDAWLESLPDLVSECVERWSLVLGAPFEGHVSFVAPATLPGGAAAVLKVSFPSEESEHEPNALAHWDGAGAVRLLAQGRARRALLLERCEPGATLWEVDDEEEANAVAAAVLRRLWRPPPPRHSFRLLSAEAARWAAALPERWQRLGRPFERQLLDEAVAFVGNGGARRARRPPPGLPWTERPTRRARAVARDRSEAARREREFDLASLLRDRRSELVRDPHPVARMRRRLDRLTGDLGVDRERARGWAVAHALVWGLYEDRVFLVHVACARWRTAARGALVISRR